MYTYLIKSILIELNELTDYIRGKISSSELLIDDKIGAQKYVNRQVSNLISFDQEFYLYKRIQV